MTEKQEFDDLTHTHTLYAPNHSPQPSSQEVLQQYNRITLLLTFLLKEDSPYVQHHKKTQLIYRGKNLFHPDSESND